MTRKEKEMRCDTHPSIGQIGEVYMDQVNNRTKGFLTKVHHLTGDIQATLEQALALSSQATRSTFRILADASVSAKELKEIELSQDGIILHCEAVVPVRNHPSVANIVYYGCNDIVRQSVAGTVSQELMLLCQVVDQNRQSHDHDFGDYRLGISTPEQVTLNNDDIRQLVSIYSETFSAYLIELNATTVRNMVLGNIVVTVRDLHNNIVSVAMAEVARIRLGNGSHLNIAEISEVATDPKHQRRGLAHYACQKLVEHLKNAGTNAIFMEARANHFGMMAVAFDCGMTPRGRLPEHCLINSPFSEVNQRSAFGDLMVFSI